MTKKESEIIKEILDKQHDFLRTLLYSIIILEEDGPGTSSLMSMNPYEMKSLHKSLDTIEDLIVNHLEEGPIEPGQPIAKGNCPCCGAELEITHGDDLGETSIIGCRSENTDNIAK